MTSLFNKNFHLINKSLRIITQGITGKSGSFHTKQGILYGSCFVGGVTPGKGGHVYLDLPVFDSVLEAKKATNCQASLIFVPAPFAADAIIEAENSGIEIIICITEGIPVKDMMEVSAIMKQSKTSSLIGPNCPGVIVPEVCKMGIMPGYIHRKGHVGVISRSGTLTYDAVWQLSSLGLGQSLCVGIGGDPIVGSSFIDVLSFMNEDENTQCILLIGEIGGSAEEEAADWIKEKCKKPVVSFIAGLSAPKGKRMGHAGAIISGNKGQAVSKIEKLKTCGVTVVNIFSEIGLVVKQTLSS